MTAAKAMASSSGDIDPGNVREVNDEFVVEQSTGQEDVFRVGALLECQTVRGSIKGEVICYDQATRLLVLQLNSVGLPGRSTEIRFINLALVRNVAELKPPDGDNSQVQLPSYLTVAQGQERLKFAEKTKNISLPDADVSIEAQRLFIAIRKTMEETRWESDRIVVLGKVSIHPPYRKENVFPLSTVKDDHKTHSIEQTIKHVQKIMEKHYQRLCRDDRTGSSGVLDDLTERRLSDDEETSLGSVSETDKEQNGPLQK